MRKYQPKDNVQKKSYYTDRFYVAPKVPRGNAEESEVFANDVKKLSERFTVLESYIEIGQLVVIIEAKHNKDVIGFAKKELGYDILSEMSAMDFLAQRGGFEVFYQMLNLTAAKRMRVKCFLEEGKSIESVNSHFRCADFAEREMYDMFGIKVNNHPYLKRILMPDDWEGHPLLKSYPLQGDEFAQWYEIDKIFGKEYRAIVGPENRDAAMVDARDTMNFARLGHEVRYGEAPKESKSEIMYQEEGGVILIDKLNTENQKQLEERR